MCRDPQGKPDAKGSHYECQKDYRRDLEEFPAGALHPSFTAHDKVCFPGHNVS